jgi:outer membrane protein assembly factor BamB
VTEGRVLAAFARSEGGRLVHSVACYVGDGDRPAWVSELCDGPANGADGRGRHEVLTLAGRNAVFCSHAGAVVAVNARTGRPAWAFRYPRVRRPRGDGRYRDLSPPVAADGRVFVAPNDADHLYAFDADTGEPLWQDGPVQFDHVLGAAGGKVVVAVAGPNRGLRGYDAATGSADSPRGWACHDAPDLPTYGRGLLTDEFVLWPTMHGVEILRLADGRPTGRRLVGPHGNLAFAGGVLLVATPTAVWGYPAPGGPANGPLTPPPIRVIDAAPPRPELRPAVRLPATLERVAVEPPPAPPIALRGEHHLVRLDATGHPAWHLDSLKRPREWPSVIDAAPRFGPHLLADAGRIVAQTTAARRLLIDAGNGRVIDDEPTAHRPWAAPPVRLGDRILAADGPGLVTAFDPDTGRPDWRFDAGREASLSGEAARPFAADGKAFAGVVRNHGVEIDRLDPHDGHRVWPAGPPLLPAGDLDPLAPDADADTLFVPLSDRLVGLRLDTGRERWSAPLPAGGPWRAAAARNVVNVYPTAAAQAEGFDPARLLEAVARRPDARRLLGVTAVGFDAWLDRTATLLLFDPATGELKQRLAVPARGPAVRLSMTPDAVTIAAGDAAYRLK